MEHLHSFRASSWMRGTPSLHTTTHTVLPSQSCHAAEPRLESTAFAFVRIYEGSVNTWAAQDSRAGTYATESTNREGQQIPLLLSLAGTALQAAARMENRLPRGPRHESRLLPFTYPGRSAFCKDSSQTPLPRSRAGKQTLPSLGSG